MRFQTDRLVVGFHGCDEDIAEKVIGGKDILHPSRNKYDWLGWGIYFWENDPERALDFAKELRKRSEGKIKKPSVVGAIINLGHCLDLTTMEGVKRIKTMYSQIKNQIKDPVSLPANRPGIGGGINGDIFLRDLDCYVIESLHRMNEELKQPVYDSVRAGFWEGAPLYPNAGFREKNHIQLCVRSERNIIAYFRPIPEEAEIKQ
jgi:hypothetical protein